MTEVSGGKKKILVVIPSLARGGAERVASMLAAEWAQKHEVVLALFKGEERAYDPGEAVRVVDLAVPASASGWEKARNALLRVARLLFLFRKEKPDRIFSFMESANFPVLLSALLLRKLSRVTVSVRNNPSRFSFCYRVLMSVLYRLPRRVVAVSEGVREELVGRFALPAERCIAIPNPVDFRAVDGGMQADRPEIPLPRGPYILAVGRLVHQKGFDLLLEVFARSRCRADHELLVLGEGPERGKLCELASELGLEGKVSFPGSVASPFPFMARARCFVLSSRFEGWPNVIPEAMACGCPVLSFDCPFGPSEIIEDGKSGILVRPEKTEALAKNMDEVVENERLRKELSAMGRARVAEFDLGSVSRRWMEGI